MPSKVPLNNVLLQNTLDLNSKSADNINSAQVFRSVILAGSSTTLTSVHRGCFLKMERSAGYILVIDNSQFSVGDTFLMANNLGSINISATTGGVSDQRFSGNSSLPGYVTQAIRLSNSYWVLISF